MDQNKYVQVTIFEPVARSSTESVRGCSTKTLSTIHEYDNRKVSRSYVRNNTQKNVVSPSVNSNIERDSSCEQSADSLRNSGKPFDIDLLLTHYARNSNMQKSINKVLEQTNERCSNGSNDRFTKQISQSANEGPLVELDAVCKIYDSLKKSSSKCSLWPMFRFHDTLTMLRSFIRQCSNKTLEEIVSDDPSMKMCKRCGVISCSKASNMSVGSHELPPKASYFSRNRILSNAISSDDDYSRTYKDMKKRFHVKEEETKCSEKCHNVQKKRTRSTRKQRKDREKVIVEGKNQFYVNTARQNVEVMVAERENDNETYNTCDTHNVTSERSLKRDTVELQDHFRNSQITKQSGLPKSLRGIPVTTTVKNRRSQQMETNSKFKDTTSNDTTANFTNNLLYNIYSDQTGYKAKFVNNMSHDKQDEWKALNKDRLSANECNEKVVRNISYEKSKSYLDDLVIRNRAPLSNTIPNIENKQNKLANVLDGTGSSVSVVTCLTRNRAKSRGREKEEFVSQLCERTCVHSRRNSNRHGFLLHSSKDKNSYLNSEFLIHDKLLASNRIARNEDKSSNTSPEKSRNYLEHCRHLEPATNIRQFNSPVYLIEDDSLENCIKTSDTLVRANESNTTVLSSSSAENLIREWMKAPQHSREGNIHDETCKKLYTSKLSTLDLNAEPQTFWSDKKYLYYIKTSIDGQHHLPAPSPKKTWRSVLSRSQLKLYHSGGRNVSRTVHDSFKPRNSQHSVDSKVDMSNFKKIENCASEKCFRKQLFRWFKSVTAVKSTRSRNVYGNRESSVSSNDNHLDDCSKNITRRIIYNESSLKSIIENTERNQKIEDTLLLYRQVLENTEKMDWQSFQRFVESLHPNQKDLWRDICKAINNEARRIAEEDNRNTEIYIEITSIPFERLKNERSTHKEIVFEMDITLGDIEKCLSRQLVLTEKERLDTLKGAGEVIKVRNDDVCDIEVVSNQAK